MRSLLTMLGIIIGIASVIAIMTLGDSISSSVTDSMSSIGANNITVGLQQKSTATETTDSGMTFSFGPRMAQMQEEGYITEEMLSDLQERYADSILGFSLTENIGSGTAQDGDRYAYVSASGVNAANLENEDLTLLAGRSLSARDQEEARRVALVSDLLVENMFDGDRMGAIVLCLVGGTIGIILGIAIASAATNMMGYAVSPSVRGIVLSVSFSVFIGVSFGYYPANRAAKLDPIEALRYE